MATSMEPVRDSHAPYWLFGAQTDGQAAAALTCPSSNTGSSFYFNSNVSNLYNNSVVEKNNWCGI